jgi:small basic protein (TIGR04137 family)
MSIHSSLRGVNTLVGQRSVFSRIERLQILMKDGRFNAETDSACGLPKVRTRFKVAGAKKKAPSEDKAAAPEGDEAPADKAKS